jgi:hypothetical protein
MRGHPNFDNPDVAMANLSDDDPMLACACVVADVQITGLIFEACDTQSAFATKSFCSATVFWLLYQANVTATKAHL